ncbi:FKBP-type peptidyl-prolyl cis-trans isomerase [Klebsiella pneumoniae]|nr:FKBP-type peptidyl-prolyl cis-trans isomerase [Klebsiella pneumoniae]
MQSWTEGLKNIKKGGKKSSWLFRRTWPYGKTGVPGIPANSTLVFDVRTAGYQTGAEGRITQPEAAGDAKAADTKADAKK